MSNMNHYRISRSRATFFLKENDRTTENYVSTENVPGPEKSKEKQEKKHMDLDIWQPC